MYTIQVSEIENQRINFTITYTRHGQISLSSEHWFDTILISEDCTYINPDTDNATTYDVIGRQADGDFDIIYDINSVSHWPEHDIGPVSTLWPNITINISIGINHNMLESMGQYHGVTLSIDVVVMTAYHPQFVRSSLDHSYSIDRLDIIICYTGANDRP